MHGNIPLLVLAVTTIGSDAPGRHNFFFARVLHDKSTLFTLDSRKNEGNGSRKYVTSRDYTHAPSYSVLNQTQLRFGAIFEISTGHRKSRISPNPKIFSQIHSRKQAHSFRRIKKLGVRCTFNRV